MPYTIKRNGQVVKSGRAEFKNEIAEETFVLKMEQRYTRTDKDKVEVIFL